MTETETETETKTPRRLGLGETSRTETRSPALNRHLTKPEIYSVNPNVSHVVMCEESVSINAGKI